MLLREGLIGDLIRHGARVDAHVDARDPSSSGSSSYTKSAGGSAARPSLDGLAGLRDAYTVWPVGTNSVPPYDDDRSPKAVCSGRGVGWGQQPVQQRLPRPPVLISREDEDVVASPTRGPARPASNTGGCSMSTLAYVGLDISQ